ncbi:MAG: Protein pmbA [Mycobacterium sp.]|nr:Protein pmbA [Mycobacterium sp.]
MAEHSHAPESRLGPEEDAAASLAMHALDVATDVAGTGAHIAVTTEVGTRALTRFAESAIHQSVTEDIRSLTLSVTVDGRTALVSSGAEGWTGAAGTDGLRRLVTAALTATRLRPTDPNWPGLAPREPIGPVNHADRATADATGDERAALVGAFVEAAGGLETAGFCETRGIATSFANSAGQLVVGSVAAATLDGIARAPSGGPAPADGSGRSSSTHVADLQGDVASAAGRRAEQLARAAAEEAIDIEPGEYMVILRPGAMVDVLGWIASGLSARVVDEGRSFARPGEAQFDPLLTLRCDPLDQRMPALPFDAQGTPRRAYDLIADGLTKELASDRRDAKTIHGIASNGGAISHRYVTSARASALLLRPGTAAPDELYAGRRRALLITDFWYTRLLDPRRLVVTGLTRNGVFLVEDGVITRPVRNVRFTQSYSEALGPGRVLGIDGESVLNDTEPAPIHTPGVALASWAITGNARG